MTSGSPMTSERSERGLVVSAIAAALVDHHLRKRGQDVSMLPQAISRLLDIERVDPAGPGFWQRPLTNDAGLGALRDLPLTILQLDDGTPLELPPLVATLRQEGGANPVFRIVDMDMGAGYRYAEWTGEAQILGRRPLPETLVTTTRGCPLKEVVSHGALDGMAIRIAGICNQPLPEVSGVQEREQLGMAITLSSLGEVVLPFQRSASEVIRP
jgi:hypothetical protein